VNNFLGRFWLEPEVRADVARLKSEHAAETSLAPPPWSDDAAAVVAYVTWLMDRDRKSTGLKSLQGKIWEEGYRSGDLKGEVYPDVAPAMQRWDHAGIGIAIFSSGSTQAQRSLFLNTSAGDLTRFIRDYFDTTTGPKTASMSYARIAQALRRPATEVLFVSDVVAELDAALTAGMQTALCVRDPAAAPGVGAHRVIGTFDELTL
jgi:enolase-phosphatase E1